MKVFIIIEAKHELEIMSLKFPGVNITQYKMELSHKLICYKVTSRSAAALFNVGYIMGMNNITGPSKEGNPEIKIENI